MGCGSSSDSASASKPHAKHKALPKENKIDWEALAAKLPPLDNSRASKEKRKEIFGRFDVNGNGFLSLAELDKVRCREYSWEYFKGIFPGEVTSSTCF